MVLCGQDYSGTSGDGGSANIYGINPVSARDLSACVNACTSQGTACVGITWEASSSQCVLKRTMFPQEQTIAVAGIDSVVRIFAGTDSGAVASTSQFDNGGFDSGALSPWVIQYTDEASVVVTNKSAYVPSIWSQEPITNNAPSVISASSSFGSLTLLQNLRVPVTAASGLAYYMTFSIGTSGFTGDGGAIGIALNTYGFGAIFFTANQPQTKVYLSGRLTSEDVSIVYLPHQFYEANGIITLDDISLVTYEQKAGLDPIPSPPVVSNASYSFTDVAVIEYSIPQLERRQLFTLTANARISLADGATTCWLAIGFNPPEQQIVYETFTTNRLAVISVSSFLFDPTTSYSFEFNCQGVAGSVLTISEFTLRAV